MANLSEAKAAKERAKELLADVGEIRGIGIARVEDGFGVKVNLAHEIEQYMPEYVNGVPLVVEITGEIRALEASQPGPPANVDPDQPDSGHDLTAAPRSTTANLPSSVSAQDEADVDD